MCEWGRVSEGVCECIMDGHKDKEMEDKRKIEGVGGEKKRREDVDKETRRTFYIQNKREKKSDQS